MFPIDYTFMVHLVEAAGSDTQRHVFDSLHQVVFYFRNLLC